MPSHANVMNVWRTLLPVLLLVAVNGCGPEGVRHESELNRVGVDEFARLVEQGGFALLDVRTPEEFSAGHIPGAINLDVQSASFITDLRGLKAEQGYLVYCRSGRRSARASGIMAEEGFRDLFDLAPGFNGWKSAGRTVVR